MCSAVALPVSELPAETVADLAGLVYERDGCREVRFDWRSWPSLLPVVLHGRLQVVRWGNRDRAELKLPPTGWTWKASVEDGKWAAVEAEPVVIPATHAYANGVWFKVATGIRGLVVRTRAGVPVAYMICEPATRYYGVMTRDEWMPVLIGQVI